MKLFGLILTYNCENLVEKTINSLSKNLFYKIICSDDGSVDNTKQKLIENNISQVITNSINYLKERTSQKIKTKLDLDDVNLKFNEQLFSWVIENLYKNSNNLTKYSYN